VVFGERRPSTNQRTCTVDMGQGLFKTCMSELDRSTLSRFRSSHGDRWTNPGPTDTICADGGRVRGVRECNPFAARRSSDVLPPPVCTGASRSRRKRTARAFSHCRPP
jgi:hypothetical protein